MEGEGVHSIARKVWVDAFPRLALTREEPLLRKFVRVRTLGHLDVLITECQLKKSGPLEEFPKCGSRFGANADIADRARKDAG